MSASARSWRRGLTARAGVLLAAALPCACGGSSEAPVVPPLDAGACEDVVDWDSFGHGFFSTHCTPCHTVNLEGDARMGAPEGVNFDTLADVRLHAPIIPAWALGASPPMPPMGGVSDDDRALLEAFLACGAPGEEALEVAACASPASRSGDVAVASQADADALCADPEVRIEGALTIASSATVTCLCEVSGDLGVEGTAADVVLPDLRHVGGSVRSHGSALQHISAPELVTIDGHLELVDLPGLADVGLDALAAVGGNVVVEDAASLPLLSLASLTTIGGDASFARSGVAEVRLYRLASVGGSLSLVQLDGWSVLGPELDALVSVGGDLHISDNAKLLGLDRCFFGLQTVGGDLVIAENPALVGIDAFPALVSVGGTLELLNNDALSDAASFFQLDTVGGLVISKGYGLTTISGFDSLTRITGPLEITGNASLVAPDAFPLLEAVEGELRVQGNAKLQALLGFPLLAATGGLAIEDNAAVTALDGLAHLTRVEGDLRLLWNGALADLSDLHGVESVAGEVRIEDNALLSTTEAEALVEAIGAENIAGGVVIERNGG